MSTAFGSRPWIGNPKFFPKEPPKPKPIEVLGAPPPPAIRSDLSQREQRAYDRGYRAGYQHGQQSAGQAMLTEGRTFSNRRQRVTGGEGNIIAIAQEVAEAYGFSSWRELRARRGDAARYARHQAMWRCVNETNNSLVKIGRILGGFDHTTVINACRVHEERMRGASADAVIPADAKIVIDR